MKTLKEIREVKSRMKIYRCDLCNKEVYALIDYPVGSPEWQICIPCYHELEIMAVEYDEIAPVNAPEALKTRENWKLIATYGEKGDDFISFLPFFIKYLISLNNQR